MLKIHNFKPYCAGSKYHRKTLKFHSLLNKIDLNPQKKKLDRLAKKNTLIYIHVHIFNYMILTFDVIKGHFRSNKILCQVPVNLKGIFFILRIKIDLIKQTVKF